MKKILLITLVALVGCSSRYRGAEEASARGYSDEVETSGACSVRRVTGGATIDCPDGTSATVRDGYDGQDGVDGTNGNDGSNGTNGNTGPSGTSGDGLTAYLYCDTQLSNTNLSVYYRLAAFNNYMFVIGGVFGSYVEINNSVIYPNDHADSYTAPVYFTYDLSGDLNGGYFRIHLDRTTQNVIVDYIDVDQTLTWELTECVYSNY